MALHIINEANRCLNCRKPMCQQGCPVHTEIPFIFPVLKIIFPILIWIVCSLKQQKRKTKKWP